MEEGTHGSHVARSLTKVDKVLKPAQNDTSVTIAVGNHLARQIHSHTYKLERTDNG